MLYEIILLAQLQQKRKENIMKNNIIPAIWFDHNAKEAFEFYSKTFPETEIEKADDIVVEGSIRGLKFIGINGGPMFKPNSSISFMHVFETKEELTAVWEKLSQKGKIMMPLDSYPFSELYAWVEDPYGVSWQLYLGKLQNVNHQKIIPTLMFCEKQQGRCKEALAFYEELFPDFESQGILEYPEGEFKGQVMHTQFKANGYTLAAMDSGYPQDFSFTEGVSLTIPCKDQEEIDYYWNKITEKGQESQCGWCKDQFGLSWQVVPKQISEILSNNPHANRALMAMKKIEIDKLINA